MDNLSFYPKVSKLQYRCQQSLKLIVIISLTMHPSLPWVNLLYCGLSACLVWLMYLDYLAYAKVNYPHFTIKADDSILVSNHLGSCYKAKLSAFTWVSSYLVVLIIKATKKTVIIPLFPDALGDFEQRALRARLKIVKTFAA